MRRLALIALLGAAALTTGCVTVFPKTEPAQLYRFGLTDMPGSETVAGAPVGVIMAPVDFDRAAQTDAILTMTGGSAAYIAGARWVAPASILFDDAVDEAFRGSPVLLLSRGELGQAQHTLRLTVRRFEADYASEGVAPAVLIEIDADLVRNDTRALVAQHRFAARVTAGDNKVGAIVEAYNAALGQVLPQVTGWTAETVKGNPVGAK
ncbi:MAG: transporter [Caulobacteraceae bacterium]|nr:transporter [Caulobacteraceae bacterium]